MTASLSPAAQTRMRTLLKLGVGYRAALALAPDADLLPGGGSLTKASVGLGNVDNTSDLLKPVSTAQQNAINAAVAALVNAAPGALDTLGELAAQLTGDESTAASLATLVAGKFPIAPLQRGVFAATTAYALYDVVLAPTGDIVTPKIAFTSGASYSAANWNILIPAAGFPGRELAAAILATTVSTGLSTTGVVGGLTDVTKDINTAALDVSPVIGSRPVLIEAHVVCFFGTTGGYGIRLYDKTSGAVLDQDLRAAATGFQIQAPSNLKALVAPAAGARSYGVKVNGTAGTNNFILEGADNLASSWIRVTER